MKTHTLLLIFFLTIGFGTLQSKAQIVKNEKVTDLIKKKRDFNKENGIGFRIQLTNGFETSIKKTNSLFKIEYPTIKTYILFESPDWKVQVGNYKTRLEADKALNQFKKKFPESIVVPR